VRCAPETEKAVLARLNGRPNDEDMVTIIASGVDKQLQDRWDSVRRGVVMPAIDSKVIRNEVPEADLESASKRQAAQSFKVFANPRADILQDSKTSCCVDYTTKKKVYFFDAFSTGVAKFARFKVDFITDDAAVANSLSQVLPKLPKSAIPKFHQSATTGLLLHNSSKDAQSGALESYVMYDSKLAVAQGAIPSVAPVLDAFAFMAASRLAGSEVLVVKGDIERDPKTGAINLILGGDGTASTGAELQGVKFAAWGAAGVSRLFDGVPSEKDLTSKPLSGVLRSSLAPPKKLIFASKKDGKAKSIDIEAAKKLFTEKYAVASSDKTLPIFEKLVQSSKVELVLLE